MKQQPLSAPHTFAKRPDHRAPVGLLIQVLIIFLLFAAVPLAAEGLPDQAAATSEVSTEPLPESEVTPEPPLNPLDAERIACFDRLWASNQEDVWFYGENGQRIVPEPTLDWLVVRLMDTTGQVEIPPADTPDNITPDATDDAATATTESFPTEVSDNVSMAGSASQPPSFESFNARYGEYFSHFLHDPDLAPFMGAYRLRRDMPREVFQTLMARLQQDPQIMYVHPAWKIADQMYAPLERIEVIWKTAANSQQRSALLQAVGAVESDDDSPSNRERVTIVPCRQSVWQAANLLAEDIHVAQAWPVLMPLVPPVGVRFSLGLNGATAGTAIPFTFEIRFTDKVKIESSTIANLNLKPGGIFHNLYDISYDVPLSAVDINRSPIRITGRIKIYATGEYSLPGIPVYYTDSNAPKSKVQLIKTDEVPVRIAAMIPENQEGFDLQVGEPAPMPAIDTSATTGAKHRFGILMLAGLALISLASATMLVLMRSRHQQAAQPENHALNRRYAAASAAVEALRQHVGLEEVAALGISLKSYLAEFAGLDADKRGGSHTAFFRRIETALPSSCQASAADVLSAIDHALARGEQSAIPVDLTEKIAKLIDDLRSCEEIQPDFSEKH